MSEQRTEQRLVKFRIDPVICNNGKLGWTLIRCVRVNPGDKTLVTSSVQTFYSLKKAKAAAAHLCRKPVEI